MPRSHHLKKLRLPRSEFDRVFTELIANGRFFEDPDYYSRYESRYRYLIELLSEMELPASSKLLDIGGGQIAILAREFFGLDTTVADVSDTHAGYIRELGLPFFVFDLCRDVVPWVDEFDVVVLSEVIEHIPIPAHVALEKVRQICRPGGLFLLTTPNLHRIRNMVHLALGRETFGRFFYPAPGASCGHVLEYSGEHLRWQIEQAGFTIVKLERRHFHHWPISIPFRVLSAIGYPLLAMPRFRDNLVAVCRA